MIKKLVKSLREYKKDAIYSIFFVFFETIMECAIPFIMAYLIDEISKGKGIMNYNLVFIYSGILVGISLYTLFLGAMAAKYSAYASSGFAKNLRYDIFKRIQSFSFENIEKFSAASLVTRMSMDITFVRLAFMTIIRTAIRGPFMLIFSLVMSFVISWKMAWIFAITIPIIFIGIVVIITIVTPMYKKLIKQYDKLNQNTEENILAIRTVKTFNQEQFEKDKFEKTAKTLKNKFLKADRIAAMGQPLMQASMLIMSALLISVGTLFIIRSSKYENSQYIWGILSPGQFQSLWVYSIQSLVSLMMLSMVIIMILMAYQSARRITEVLNEKATITNINNPKFEIPNSKIEFRNVSFKYNLKGENFALQNINLEINPGDFVGIIGGTGASKTTLINLLGRLYDVTEGEIILGGNNIKEYDLTTLRNYISYVPQKNMLFSGTIKTNLQMGDKNATLAEMEEALEISCADEFVKNYKSYLDHHVSQQGTNFSGGQKQRLCLARAILKKAPIIILDDATSAIDSQTDIKIKKALKTKLATTTKIIIAQRISAISECNKIIVMNDGFIDQVGSHDELLKTNIIYQEVYRSQHENN